MPVAWGRRMRRTKGTKSYLKAGLRSMASWVGLKEGFSINEFKGKGRGVRARLNVGKGVVVTDEKPIAVLASDIEYALRSDSLLANADVAPIISLCKEHSVRYPAMALLMASKALQHSEGVEEYWVPVNDLSFARMGDLPPIYQLLLKDIQDTIISSLGSTSSAHVFVMSTYDHSWFARILGTLHINAARNHDTGSTVLLHAGSMFNHSCNPNAHFQWDVSEGEVVGCRIETLRDVEDGEEVCISYVEADSSPREEKSTAEAKMRLIHAYGIPCGDACDCVFP